MHSTTEQKEYGQRQSVPGPASEVAMQRVQDIFRQKNDFLRWSKYIENRFDQLNNLERGWDSYDASPIRYTTAKFVGDMLEALYFDGLKTPVIAPLKSGGIQLEWHRGEDCLEIEVERPNFANCYICIEADDIEDEFRIKSDFSKIREMLKQLM